MTKRIALFCALIGLVAFIAAPAYAEVQNIKISGDIQALGVYRSNYDLEDGKVIFGGGADIDSYLAEDNDSFLMSIIRLRVDADLTDNVAACIRLANLRDWDGDGTNTSDIILDLANITLKEMLYSPLTLIIGRQELMYGNGLVVGPGLFQDPDNSIEYNDLSLLHGYDAVRAILDYDPWTMDLLLAKITEADDVVTGTLESRDSDVDLYGANLGYRFDQYDAEVEGYLFYKRDPTYGLVVNVSGSTSDQRTFVENEVYTMGLRGSLVPIENLTLSGEVAGQLGEIRSELDGVTTGPLTKDREALAANVAGKYNFANVRFMPTLGVEYLYLSGEEAGVEGDFDAWDPMYRGKKMSSIRDYLENLYTTNDPADTSGWTNQHTIKAMGSADLGELVDGLSMNLAYLHYWFDEEPIAGADDNIGDEINMKLTYDYTEDVQFALDGAWFIPGDYYDTVHTANEAVYGTGSGLSTSTTTAQAATSRVANDTAVSIIGSCKVTF